MQSEDQGSYSEVFTGKLPIITRAFVISHPVKLQSAYKNVRSQNFQGAH